MDIVIGLPACTAVQWWLRNTTPLPIAHNSSSMKGKKKSLSCTLDSVSAAQQTPQSFQKEKKPKWHVHARMFPFLGLHLGWITISTQPWRSWTITSWLLSFLGDKLWIRCYAVAAWNVMFMSWLITVLAWLLWPDGMLEVDWMGCSVFTKQSSESGLEKHCSAPRNLD